MTNDIKTSFQKVQSDFKIEITLFLCEYFFNNSICLYLVCEELGKGVKALKVFQGIPKWRPAMEIFFSALWSVFSCNYVLLQAGLTEKVLYNVEQLPYLVGAKDISDELLIDYIEKVGLKNWFDRQKDGLDTLLGERGVFVSTGQRQRLNLIRGLLRRDKEIYLLDEPTSNVDVETEEKMIELIKTVLKDKTVVVVTHRPKIIDICDNCYKFENSILSRVKQV